MKKTIWKWSILQNKITKLYIIFVFHILKHKYAKKKKVFIKYYNYFIIFKYLKKIVFISIYFSMQILKIIKLILYIYIPFVPLRKQKLNY